MAFNRKSDTVINLDREKSTSFHNEGALGKNSMNKSLI